MRHELRMEAHGVTLRPVELVDAEFILGLRRDAVLSRYIGDTSPSLDQQRAWMESYFERPGDFYFVIETRGCPVGTVGIYDVDDQGAEWGRWIVRSGVPAAAGSALLVYRTAFSELGLSRLFCRTVQDNQHVVSFHDRVGLRRIAVERDGVTIGGVSRDFVVHELRAEEWPKLEAELERSAAMAARMLDR